MLEVTPVTVLRTEQVDASPPSGTDKDRRRLNASTVLMGLSLALTWVLLYLYLFSGLEQAHAQSSLYKEFRTELAGATAPTGAPIPIGSPVALISVPDAGLRDAVVVEGSRPDQLQDGPGHVLGSVLPGQVGVSTIAGRSLSFGAPFKELAGLRVGATITATTAQGVFTYQVIGVREDGDPFPPAADPASSRIVLVTASRGGLQASTTLYVDAELVGDAAPAGARSAPDEDNRQMSVGADITTLALLALSLQLLVLTVAAFGASWTRWSPRATWIAVAPCVVGALWLVSSIGTQVLPGLV